ncbi:MAG: flagellar hook-associated protein FlgK, partial [Desulfobacterales bacterium]|nr:flagellar hook-associated protein FlgK [Desulfobacterales bacterium]
MSGLSATLNIAKNAIAAQQAGLNITGHNVANVNNPDFSRQRADHVNSSPIIYGGHLFGTGVKVGQVQRTVDQLLENRLTTAASKKAALVETQGYMAQLEATFSTQSATGLNANLGKFWNAWHDLSNMPGGSAQRIQVRDMGNKLADKFKTINGQLDQMKADVKGKIGSTLDLINSYSAQLADLNRQIQGMEPDTPANDLKDRQNALLDKLGKLVDVNIIRQGNGSVTVNLAGGTPLVSGNENYSLATRDGKIIRQGSSSVDITHEIRGGKLAGLLTVRDEIIPKFQHQLNELSREIIWNINKIHSQGVGQNYFSSSLTGTDTTNDTGRLSSLKFGNRIDYTKVFKMWIRDQTQAKAGFKKVEMDMNLSTATLSNFKGTAPGGARSRYRFTVVDGAHIGKRMVTQTNGSRLGEVVGTTAGTAASAANQILMDQTITIYGSKTGSHKIQIKDMGGDAGKSMADIAEKLNKIPGVKAHAAKTRAEFNLKGINNAQDGDRVQYELSVDGKIHKQSFVVDGSKGSLKDQFEASLESAVKAVNKMNGNTDLSADGLTMESAKGATLGIQKFQVQDNAGVKLSNFSNFNDSDTVKFTLSSNGVPTSTVDVSVNLKDVDTQDQAKTSKAFYTALQKALKDKPFTLSRNEADGSIVIRTTNGADVTLKGAGGDTGKDAAITLTHLSGTDAATGDGKLSFNDANDSETFKSQTRHDDTLHLSVPGNGEATGSV